MRNQVEGGETTPAGAAAGLMCSPFTVAGGSTPSVVVVDVGRGPRRRRCVCGGVTRSRRARTSAAERGQRAGGSPGGAACRVLESFHGPASTRIAQTDVLPYAAMETSDLLIEAFGRVREIVHQVVEGLTHDDVLYRPDRDANSIAWLIWHLTRIEDDHVADLAGVEQVWTAGGWSDRISLPFDVSATGYGFDSDDVAAVRCRAAQTCWSTTTTRCTRTRCGTSSASTRRSSSASSTRRGIHRSPPECGS